MPRRAVRLSGVPADPFQLWQHLHKNPTHGFFLGPASPSPFPSLLYMSLAEPRRVFNSLPAIKSEGAWDLPRFVGVIGFEAGRLFDPAIKRLPRRPDPLNFPVMCFGDYDRVLKVDLQKKEMTVLSNEAGDVERVRRALSVDSSPSAQNDIKRKKLSFQYPSVSHFLKMVSAAKSAIGAGDIYQANLSLRFSSRFTGDPLTFYEALSRRNPSPYACAIKQGKRWVLSCSPELLIEINGRTLVTRPIAGTRPRGKSSREDNAKRGQLLMSPKERAEHIMLVDLERNDLGRVAEPGSVRVTEQFAIERYSHVMHIVSEVRGRLKKGCSSLDAVRAVFPGGTITGCPKIKSIEIIQALEKVSRGPFYGSAGFFSWNGNAKFNILIRTALVQNEKMIVQAGAGIVADSNPRREYKEAMAKARVLLETA